MQAMSEKCGKLKLKIKIVSAKNSSFTYRNQTFIGHCSLLMIQNPTKI